MEKMQLYKLVGKRIRIIREAQNVTQAELSEQIPISRPSVVNIEQGNHRIQLHVLFAIADALNVSICQILEDRNDEALKYAERKKN